MSISTGEPLALPPSWRQVLLRSWSTGIDATPERGCLDEFALAAVLDGAATPALLEHLASCAACTSHVAALMTIAADPQVANAAGWKESEPGRRKSAVWRMRGVLGIAIAVAATIAVVVVSPTLVRRWDAQHRGPTITAATIPVPLSPVGDLATVDTFRWRPVGGATHYRLSLFDSSGDLLLQDETSATTLALPDSIALRSGAAYLWKVEAQTAPGRWTASDLIEFRRHGKDPSTPHAPASADSLTHRVGALDDSALARLAHDDPPAYRNAIADVLAAAVHFPAAQRDSLLGVARRLADRYAASWHDPFLPGQVARFIGWTAAQRATKVSADSLRRSAIAAYSHDGVRAALQIWRRSLDRSTSIGDSAGIAATLGNIGAALSQSGAIDSADAVLTRSYRLAAAIGNHPVEANALGALAGISEARNDPATARERYTEAIVLRERIGDRRGVAADNNNLGGLARAAGDYAAARRYLETALTINRTDGREDVAATNLVNLASLDALTGDLALADRRYRDAIAIWRSRGADADLADALHGLGALRARRGDYAGARQGLQEALTIYRRTDDVANAIAVEELLSGVLAATGDFQHAIDTLRDAEHLGATSGLSDDARAAIAVAEGDLSAQLKLSPAAARYYERARSLYSKAGNRRGVGEAMQGLGMLRAEDDDHVGAVAALNAALTVEVSQGDVRAAALTRIWLGDVALSRGDTVVARREVAQARAGLEKSRDPVALAAALGESASLEFAARHLAAAESLFRAGLASVAGHPAPALSWRLHAGLAATRADRGGWADADREYRASIAEIEQTSRSLVLAERRAAFRSDKWEVYTAFSLLEIRRHDVAAGFDAAERGRASEMRETLAGGMIVAPTDTSAALVMREQDLRHRIGDLTAALAGLSGADRLLRGIDVSGSSDATRDALLRSQEAYADLMLELRERAPRHAALVETATSSWHAVARRLAAGQVMIEYLLGDSSSIAFVIRHDTIAAVPLPVTRRDVARLVDFARGTIVPHGSQGADSLWRAPLRRLHRGLIAPITAAGLLAGASDLIVVPHVELNYLPFAALLDDGAPSHFLVERYRIETTPSASVWLSLGDRVRPHPTRGLLAMIPVPDALPGSRDEARSIARATSLDPRIVTGSDATEARFRLEAPSSRIIHLATYGVLNKQNPLFSFIQLHPDSGNDGRLEVHEVFGLQLNAELVVLSACQTALASGAVTDVPAGDDWIGLARAFLSAGAQRVVASLWPVQDQATATLMAEFYRRYAATRDVAAALTDAQRAMIAEPATASPYLWAGFELVGGR